MKRTIRMKAYDGNGTRVAITCELTVDHLVRQEVTRLVADTKDALMQILPPMRYSHFNLSDARFGK